MTNLITSLDENGGGGSTSVYKFKITCSCRKCDTVETEEDFLIFCHPFDIALREVGAAINAALVWEVAVNFACYSIRGGRRHQSYLDRAHEEILIKHLPFEEPQPYDKDTQ